MSCLLCRLIRRASSSAVVALAATAVLLGGSAERTGKPGSDLQAAAMKKESLQLASQLIQRFSRDDNAVALLAIVNSRQGNTAEAARQWKRCLAMNPRRADAYEGLGTIAFKKGENDRAILLWRKALEIDPRMKAVYDYLARALMHAGRTQEVVEILQKHVTIDVQSALSHYWLGQAYIQLKDYEKAKEHYQATIEIQPELYHAYYGMATASARLGDSEAAKEYRKKYAQMKAKDREIQQAERAEFDDIDTVRQGLAATYTDAGRVYYNHGYFWTAEKHWKKAAALDPRDPVCRQRLAAMYQKHNRTKEALEAFEQLVEIEPENTLFYLNMGVIHARLKHVDKAEKIFQKMCQLQPERSTGYLSLAQLYLQENTKLAEAIELAEKATRLEPIAPSYFILSLAYDKNGELSKARTAIKKALELDPDNSRYQQISRSLKEKK